MNKKIPIALGMFLLAGALFGSVKALKNVVNYIPDGNWSFAGPQLLFFLAFVYIATVGFKLIKNNTHVAKQAKWIFLLQAPIISIQDIFHWSWSTGLQGFIGYSSKYGVLTHFPIPFYQAGGSFYFNPADTMVGINFVASGLAWIAHKITQQTIQSATSDTQSPVEGIALNAKITAMFNHHSLSAWLKKWTKASSILRFLLGVVLVFGAIAGAIGTLEGIDGYFSDDDYLRGIAYILYLITFIYIGVIGFRLSGNFGDVTKQAKWIFALQTPIFNIPHLINWSWSTGIGANIGFIEGQFLIEMPQLQVPDIYFLYPDDEFGIGLNLAALLFAYLLHLLGKQNLNVQISATQATIAPNAQTSEDHYVQAYQELQTKTQDIATWAKALATSNGDNDVAEASYLRNRVEALGQTNALNQAPDIHQTHLGSEEKTENNWSFKKKFAAGFGAISLAILIILFASGTLELNASDETSQQAVEDSTEQMANNQNEIQSTQEENNAKLSQEAAELESKVQKMFDVQIKEEWATFSSAWDVKGSYTQNINDETISTRKTISVHPLKSDSSGSDFCTVRLVENMEIYRHGNLAATDTSLYDINGIALGLAEGPIFSSLIREHLSFNNDSEVKLVSCTRKYESNYNGAEECSRSAERFGFIVNDEKQRDNMVDAGESFFRTCSLLYESKVNEATSMGSN